MVIAFFAIVIFLMIDVICSKKNDVVVDLPFVNVGGHNVRVFPFQKFVGKLHTDLVGFLIRHFSRHERLYQMKGMECVSPVL